jgi:hypothetical protein
MGSGRNETPMSTSELKPFASAAYKKNARKSDSPCALCGREVKASGMFAEAVDGGARFATKEETVDESDSGYMGCHEVGSDCARRLRKAGFKILTMTEERSL